MAETLKVAVAQRGFWNSSFIEFALQQGLFKKEGLDIEILYAEGGRFDFDPRRSRVNRHCDDQRHAWGHRRLCQRHASEVSAEATGATDAFWYARPESGIKTIKDTAGKTVAFSSPGSSTNLIILQLTSQEKATPKLVPTGGLPGTLTQVMSGQVDVGWSVPPFVLKDLAEGRLQIIARGSDVEAIRNQTIRVNVANANALKNKRDAFVRYIQVISRAIDWAYSGDAAIDAYASFAKVPRDLAQRTRDEFYPKQSLQLSEVCGLDLTLNQALEYKYITSYITSPLSVADVQKGLIDIVMCC
jgi:NitT/TauT family transport system substrate-binding protein